MSTALPYPIFFRLIHLEEYNELIDVLSIIDKSLELNGITKIYLEKAISILEPQTQESNENFLINLKIRQLYKYLKGLNKKNRLVITRDEFYELKNILISSLCMPGFRSYYSTSKNNLDSSNLFILGEMDEGLGFWLKANITWFNNFWITPPLNEVEYPYGSIMWIIEDSVISDIISELDKVDKIVPSKTSFENFTKFLKRILGTPYALSVSDE